MSAYRRTDMGITSQKAIKIPEDVRRFLYN